MFISLEMLSLAASYPLASTRISSHSAYFISMMSVSDAQIYRKYTDATPPIVKKYGGKFLARGGEIVTIEGEPYEDRLVLLEFPSQQAINDWMADPDYQRAMVFRHASSDARIFVIDGCENTMDPDPHL